MKDCPFTIFSLLGGFSCRSTVFNSFSALSIIFVSSIDRRDLTVRPCGSPIPCSWSVHQQFGPVCGKLWSNPSNQNLMNITSEGLVPSRAHPSKQDGDYTSDPIATAINNCRMINQLMGILQEKQRTLQEKHDFIYAMNHPNLGKREEGLANIQQPRSNLIWKSLVESISSNYKQVPILLKSLGF